MLKRLCAVALVVLALAACGGGGGRSTSASDSSQSTLQAQIPGVVFEKAPSRNHTQGHVDYGAKKPPTGGNHNPYPLTCGYYDQQPPDEFAVHSLEHGAVWIAYSPTLAPQDVAVLKALTKTNPKVLVTPYAGLDSPVVAVAWEHRLELPSVNDPRLTQFIAVLAGATSAPEGHSGCLGVGQPAA